MRALLIGTILCFAGTAFAEPEVIKLWPAGKVPGEKIDIGPEKVQEPKAGDKNPVVRITNVVDPTITVYRPEKNIDTGTAIIIAPGGGYSILAWEHEGTQTAEWLQKIGVTGVLLKYRVPRRPDQSKDQPPIGALQDAQRAISLVRSKSQAWGIKSDKIGILGFSAGGHLAAWASTNFDKRSYEPFDAADEASTRPDFAVLIYAGGLVGPTTNIDIGGNKIAYRPEQLAPEIRVSKLTPPSFLVHAADDKMENSIAYFQALRTNGVQAEVHIYGSGGHGFGMRRIDHPIAAWTARCEDWLRKQSYLAK